METLTTIADIIVKVFCYGFAIIVGLSLLAEIITDIKELLKDTLKK